MSDKIRGECPDRQTLAAFAEGVLKGAEGRAFLLHVLSCPECRRQLAGYYAGESDPVAISPEELQRARELSDRLLTRFLLADAPKAWARLAEQLAFALAVLESDVIAAGRREYGPESIFFRAVSPGDRPGFWQAEMHLPEENESKVRFTLTDSARRPIRAGRFTLCGIVLPVSGGECFLELADLHRNLQDKTVSFQFPDGSRTPGVPLFFEDVQS